MRCVLCCGNLVRDILVGPVEEPGWGRTTWVRSIEETFGGNGANTSYTLARLGESVRLMGTVGQDEAGTRVLAQLEAAGVNVKGVRRSALSTPTTIALVHASGARAFLHQPGASHEPFDDVLDIVADMVRGCNRFHLANVFALPALRSRAGELVARARDGGATVSIDTGWDARGEWLSTLRPCLPHADLLFVNDDEARELTGQSHPIKAARELQRHGVRNVVVKLGAAGCFILAGEESIASPAFQVPVVDTTGAGDCFAGGFLAALQRGASYIEAAQFANAVGALSVQKLGGTTGLMTFDETAAWAASQQPRA